MDTLSRSTINYASNVIDNGLYESSVSAARTNIAQAFKFIGWRNAASRISCPGIPWLMGPSKGLFCRIYWLGVLRF